MEMPAHGPQRGVEATVFEVPKFARRELVVPAQTVDRVVAEARQRPKVARWIVGAVVIGASVPEAVVPTAGSLLDREVAHRVRDEDGTVRPGEGARLRRRSATRQGTGDTANQLLHAQELVRGTGARSITVVAPIS